MSLDVWQPPTTRSRSSSSSSTNPAGFAGIRARSSSLKLDQKSRSRQAWRMRSIDMMQLLCVPLEHTEDFGTALRVRTVRGYCNERSPPSRRESCGRGTQRAGRNPHLSKRRKRRSSVCGPRNAAIAASTPCSTSLHDVVRSDSARERIVPAPICQLKAGDPRRLTSRRLRFDGVGGPAPRIGLRRGRTGCRPHDVEPLASSQSSSSAPALWRHVPQPARSRRHTLPFPNGARKPAQPPGDDRLALVRVILGSARASRARIDVDI